MSDNNLTPRIEQLAPELEKIIATSEPIQHLADGFGGAQGPAEGPLWWEEGGYLLFSDIHNNRRMKYQPGSGVSLFLEPTNRANGLTRDLQGRLVACEHDSRRVTRQEADGSITVVANSFQGRRLNRPNDVVVRSDGCIYFTDPWSSPAAPEQWDLQESGVYRMTPDLGTLSLLADDFVLPNGLAFSPDESVLYINDTRRGHIRAFELLASGMLCACGVLGVRSHSAPDIAQLLLLCAAMALAIAFLRRRGSRRVDAGLAEEPLWVSEWLAHVSKLARPVRIRMLELSEDGLLRPLWRAAGA